MSGNYSSSRKKLLLYELLLFQQRKPPTLRVTRSWQLVCGGWEDVRVLDSTGDSQSWRFSTRRVMTRRLGDSPTRRVLLELYCGRRRAGRVQRLSMTKALGNKDLKRNTIIHEENILKNMFLLVWCFYWAEYHEESIQKPRVTAVTENGQKG